MVGHLRVGESSVFAKASHMLALMHLQSLARDPLVNTNVVDGPKGIPPYVLCEVLRCDMCLTYLVSGGSFYDECLRHFMSVVHSKK